MNPPPAFRPAAPRTANREIWQVITPGRLTDADLHRRIARLGERFRDFLRHAPPGPARGELVTPELRAACEGWLPAEEIAAALKRLLRLAFIPPYYPPELPGAASWPELLAGFPPGDSIDPSRWLARLAGDALFRRDFLFHFALPRRHGCAFGRYPDQLRVAGDFLRSSRVRRISCLDAACGTGEGTWEMAALIEQLRGAEGMRVRGETLGVLEAYAAARSCFPHDPEREAEHRRGVEAVSPEGRRKVLFSAADLLAAPPEGDFTVILCNGVLGGPLLHRHEEIRTALEILAQRLAPGGIILAADRFHEGWRRKVTPGAMNELLREAGLRPVEAPEGVVAWKERPARRGM